MKTAEEIKKIKSTRMPASIPDGVALHYKQENAVINKAKQEVINELLEWINENKNDYMCRANTQHISGKSFSPHMAGASITVYTDGFVDELKEKLNEMKGE